MNGKEIKTPVQDNIMVKFKLKIHLNGKMEKNSQQLNNIIKFNQKIGQQNIIKNNQKQNNQKLIPSLCHIKHLVKWNNYIKKKKMLQQLNIGVQLKEYTLLKKKWKEIKN